MQFKVSVLVFLGLVSQVHAAALYEETFNVPEPRIRLANGAVLGGPGTGVSGKIADRAYSASPSSTDQAVGSPMAEALEPITPKPLSAFTSSFWYFLNEHTPDLQVLVETATAAFFLHGNGIEVRLTGGAADGRANTFVTGPRGVWLDWTNPGRWIFVVSTWEQASNKLTVYQGTSTQATTLLREMSRPSGNSPLIPRKDLKESPETFGNTHSPKHDRPLAGRLDNFRIYDRLLTPAEMELIRAADLKNQPVVLK